MSTPRSTSSFSAIFWHTCSWWFSTYPGIKQLKNHFSPVCFSSVHFGLWAANQAVPLPRHSGLRCPYYQSPSPSRIMTWVLDNSPATRSKPKFTRMPTWKYKWVQLHLRESKRRLSALRYCMQWRRELFSPRSVLVDRPGSTQPKLNDPPLHTLLLDEGSPGFLFQ